MPSVIYNVRPIEYKSQCITFPEWVSLFTLCLAPLIAHIASGTPQVSYLHHTHPKWYDRLCHYNPTSIIWRYAAITDRRLRATRWSRIDLAASNAIFWTSKGWEGGENLVVAAAPHCSRCPELTHVQFVSVTMLKTIITTLQGVSALYSLIVSLAGLTGLDAIISVDAMGVDIIFLPLAVLGLLRLCAATWLTEDFQYNLRSGYMHTMGLQNLPISAINDRNVQLMGSSDSDALDPFLISPLPTDAHFKSPKSSWPSRIFRALYLLFAGGAWTLSFLFLMPGVPSTRIAFTFTNFLVALFYFLLLSVSIVIYTFYFTRGQTTTTLLPCISSQWYRVYTLLVMSSMFVLIVIASIETNKGPDSLYTSGPRWTNLGCSSLVDWWSISPSSTFSGLASMAGRNATSLGQNYTSLPVAKVSEINVSSGVSYRLYNFTGYCVGRFHNMGG